MAQEHVHRHDAQPAAGQPREPIPALTDEDRRAAFPQVAGHSVHDDAFHYFAQFSRLEAWEADNDPGFAWEGQGWVGQDLERLWLRTEGEYASDRTESADVELLYGRSISRWWDLVAGARHEFAPGDSRTWLAIGFAGLAPYKFEVEATAYLGESGRSAASIEAEYELLITNRLILQPLVELEAFGRSDEARLIGSGLSTIEAGLRLRYEITRRFAPYIGFTYQEAFGNTRDLLRAAGEDSTESQFVVGVRGWF